MQKIVLSAIVVLGMMTLTTGCSNHSEGASKCGASKCGTSAKKCGEGKENSKCGASDKCGSK